MTSTVPIHDAAEGLGTGIGLGIPLVNSKAADLGLGLGSPPDSHLRWPYKALPRSSSMHAVGAYDSSPTPSSPSSYSSSSDSDIAMPRSASATHDVLLSYFSPTLLEVSEKDGGKKVYYLSTGPRLPVAGAGVGGRRCKSETFRFPLPPSKGRVLKSALRSSKPFKASPSLRTTSWKMQLALSPHFEEEGGGRQGWSPYSSAYPTPRQTSGQHRFSPPSSTSSSTLVSDDSDTESLDAVKLARLNASLFLLDQSVSELPLSAAEEVGGGSVEEKMAYMCGLGYMYRKASNEFVRREEGSWFDKDEYEEGEVRGRKMARVVSNATSGCSSPILSGALAFEREEDEGDETVRPTHTPRLETELGAEFTYLFDPALWGSVEEEKKGVRDEQMSPPLTTPELGFESSPMLLDRWPSPVLSRKKGIYEGLEGCRPYPNPPSLSSSTFCPTSIKVNDEEEVTIKHASRTTITSVLTRPRPLQSSTSSSSLFSLSSHPPIQAPVSATSILSRPRPIPSRAGDSYTFANKPLPLLRPKLSGMSKSASTPLDLAKQRGKGGEVKIPQRKSSLDLRTAAGVGEKVVHPNSVCLDAELQKKFHSSASPYLNAGGEVWKKAATAARVRRGREEGGEGGMKKSFSLPVLFTAKTAAQRKGAGREKGGRGRSSVVSVGPAVAGEGRLMPPEAGVLVVREKVITSIGLAL